MISSCSSKTGRRKERSYALLVLKGKSCCAARSVAEVFKRSPYGNSPYRQHDVVEGRPSAALLSTVQLTDPEEAAEVCSREDSAMRLADERLSNSGARHTAIPVFCQGTDTRTSSSSLKVSIPAMAARAVVTLRICMLIQPAPAATATAAGALTAAAATAWAASASSTSTLRQVSCHTAYMPYYTKSVLTMLMQATRLWLHRVRGPLPQEGAASAGRLSLLPGPMRRACADSGGGPL